MKKVLKSIVKLILCVVLVSLPVHAADIDTDVVIVGAGGAGLSAALTASQGGLKVVLLEKDVTVGGTTRFAEGVFAVESEMQRRNWVDLTKDQVFKQEMQETRWGTNASLIRRFHNESAKIIDWLLDLGVKFRGPESNFFGNNPTWHLVDGMARSLISNFQAKVTADKNITLMLETPGMELITKNGAVVGVVAENEDGKFNINAKHGVIIATGGFADSPEMIKKHVGLENVSVVVGLKRTGDGINMAMAAGAVTEGLGLMHNLAVKKVAQGGNAIAELPLSMLANQPRNVWINSNGERFCDEWIAFDFASGSNAIKRENAVWSIFDENLRNYYMTKGTDAGIGVIGEAMTKMTNFDELWNNAVKANDPYIVKGSLKDIAAKSGIPYEALQKTMNDYNANAAKNIDPDFAKDRQWLQQFDLSKPLYAIRMEEIAMTTLGGIRVNKELQALDKDLKPIPGLYVTGNDVGGLFVGSYSLHSASGTTFGFAIGSGRMAVTDILVKMGKAEY